MTEGRSIFHLAFAALGAWLAYLLAPILAPFPIGGPLADLGRPAVPRLVRWRFPRLLAVVLAFPALLLALLVAAVLKMWVRHLREFHAGRSAVPSGQKRRAPKSPSP